MPNGRRERDSAARRRRRRGHLPQAAARPPEVSRAIPDARCLIAMDSEPEVASRLSADDFTWERAPASWQRSMRELAAVMSRTGRTSVWLPDAYL